MRLLLWHPFITEKFFPQRRRKGISFTVIFKQCISPSGESIIKGRANCHYKLQLSLVLWDRLPMQKKGTIWNCNEHWWLPNEIHYFYACHQSEINERPFGVHFGVGDHEMIERTDDDNCIVVIVEPNLAQSGSWLE